MHQLIVTNHIDPEVFKQRIRDVMGHEPHETSGNVHRFNLHQFVLGGEFRKELAEAHAARVKQLLGGQATVELVDPEAAPPVAETPAPVPEPEAASTTEAIPFANAAEAQEWAKGI